LNLFGEFLETIDITMDSTALLAMAQRRRSA